MARTTGNKETGAVGLSKTTNASPILVRKPIELLKEAFGQAWNEAEGGKKRMDALSTFFTVYYKIQKAIKFEE